MKNFPLLDLMIPTEALLEIQFSSSLSSLVSISIRHGLFEFVINVILFCWILLSVRVLSAMPYLFLT